MRMLYVKALWLSVAIAVLSASEVQAHHGAPGYDFSKALNLEGNVVEVQWKNPHVYFTIENTGADGRPHRLDIEAASLSTVLAFGLHREMLAPGTHVKILAFGRLLDPDGANYKGATVTLPDGSVYFLENTPGSRPVREAIAASAIGGKWLPASSASFGEYMAAETRAHGPVQGGAPGAAAQGQSATAAAGAPKLTCAMLGKMASIPFGTSALYVLRTIEIGAKAVTMKIDADGFVLKREIDLAPGSRTAKLPPAQLGHSIGHWEGQTLVIDTTGFSPVPGQGAHKHMVERLALTDDRRQLKYEFTVEDPDVYPAPFHYSMLWNHRPDLAMSGAACDDKSAGKFLTVK
jgi:Family of unknown function (DUF6152)